jgi:hypothetical protein
MSAEHDVQPDLREAASKVLRRLPASEREALLVKGWMSHDARWFMAVAGECGMQVANRVNRAAAHATGEVEARRLARALGWEPVATREDCLLAQEILIGLLGPDLLDYGVTRVGDDAYRVHVRRCFAHDNAVRAEIAADYECGVFARVSGWLDGLGVTYQVSPGVGRCLKCAGRECAYTVTLDRRTSEHA